MSSGYPSGVTSDDFARGSNDSSICSSCGSTRCRYCERCPKCYGHDPEHWCGKEEAEDED